MADNKAVNQTAAKPEEAKADKKAKANDGKKKVPFTAKVKNFFGRITKYFRDTKSELKKVVWPSKEDTRNNTITVIVVVVIAGCCAGAAGHGVWRYHSPADRRVNRLLSGGNYG